MWIAHFGVNWQLTFLIQKSSSQTSSIAIFYRTRMAPVHKPIRPKEDLVSLFCSDADCTYCKELRDALALLRNSQPLPLPKIRPKTSRISHKRPRPQSGIDGAWEIQPSAPEGSDTDLGGVRDLPERCGAEDEVSGGSPPNVETPAN
jgi:hypothetical protein